MNPASSVAEALDEGTQYLARHRPRTPRLDAEVLLCHVIGHNRTQLYVRSHDPIAGPSLQRYRELLERRAQGAPVAYLVGSKEFYGRSFSVTPAVLIPRPETELVVEEALQLSSQSGLVRPRLLDVGTGSGCLAITLALEVEEAVVRACDVSPAALEVAAENLRLHHLERRIKLFEGDLLEALPERTPRFDGIVSNLPYVGTEFGPRPESGVVRYEPHLALFAGADGLELLRRLVQQATRWLNPGGWLVLEMAAFQIEGMEAVLQERGFSNTRIVPDLSGLPRVLSGRWEA